MKNVLQKIIVSASIVGLLTGCATYEVMKLGIIDKSNKSMLIPPSTALSMGDIKRMLIKNGWKFTANTTGRNTSGTTYGGNININQVNLTKSRYTMNISETTRMSQFVLTVHVSIVDNTTQEEVLTLFGDSLGAGGVFTGSTAQELEKALKEMEVAKKLQKPKSSGGGEYVTIKLEKDIYTQGKLSFFVKNDTKVNGLYQVFSEKRPGSYGIFEYKDGLKVSAKIYSLNGIFLSSLTYQDGEFVKERRFDRNQSLSAIIQIKNGKPHGIGKHFYPTGELNYEINYENGKAIDGYKYQLDGSKSKMTEAHFYKLKLN